jgi:hypothetical protein
MKRNINALDGYSRFDLVLTMVIYPSGARIGGGVGAPKGVSHDGALRRRKNRFPGSPLGRDQ